MHIRKTCWPVWTFGGGIQDRSQTSQYTIKDNHYVKSWAIINQEVQPNPPQTQYADEIADITAEGMLPLSYVELYSLIQAYSHIAPGFQAIIKPTLTV